MFRNKHYISSPNKKSNRIKGVENKDASIFEDLDKLEIEYFKGVYKDDNRVNIAKIVHMTSHFPRFVSE